MENSIDPILRKKLILVKQLYQNAVILSNNSQNIINRILTIITFDLSIETFLGAIVNHFNPSKDTAGNFQGLVQQCREYWKGVKEQPFTNERMVQHIHTLRNSAQHKLKYPNETDVTECRIYCRDFLNSAFEEIWGINFEKFNVIELINHKNVRSYLNQAENAFAIKDYQESAKCTAIAYALSTQKVERAIIGRLPKEVSTFLVGDNTGTQLKVQDCEKVYQSYKRMQESIFTLRFGIDYSALRKFKTITGVVLIDNYTQNHSVNNTKSDIQESEADFALNFCIDTVLNIENIVGNLDNPFGVERWDLVDYRATSQKRSMR